MLVGRFIFLRECAIQRGEGPKERSRLEPLGGVGGGMVIWDCISCFLKAVGYENMQPKANLKTWILPKLLIFKIDFFGAETTLRMYFTVLENKVTKSSWKSVLFTGFILNSCYFMIKIGIKKCLVRTNLIPAHLLVDRFERHLLSGDLENESCIKICSKNHLGFDT